MKRHIREFPRSIIPQDSSQLLLVVGSILLLICMQLRCYPLLPGYSPGLDIFLFGSYEDPLASVLQSWLRFSILALIPIVLAGAAGLLICFRPGSHPARRILGFVLLPALGGIAAICGRFVYVDAHFLHPGSLLRVASHERLLTLKDLWGLGPALHVSLLGITLVVIFSLRLAAGKSNLPLSLPFVEIAPTPEAHWRRILVFVWISIAGVSVLGLAAGALLDAVYHVLLKLVNYRLLPPFNTLDVAFTTACLAGIAAWAIGKDRWKELREFTRLPEIKFALLGVAIPTAIVLMPNIAAYASDRIHWATFNSGEFPPPAIASYFSFPNPLLFWYLIAAACEEVIWRGYLQPRFAMRYGLIRGIFLLGLVWSAFHFLGDFRKITEDYQVLSTFAGRLGFCIPMSYVLGWLTLRSRSIWPAALVHGISNVWIFSAVYRPSGPQSILISTIIIDACWGLLGFTLFRYWPPPTRATDLGGIAERATEQTGPLPL